MARGATGWMDGMEGNPMNGPLPLSCWIPLRWQLILLVTGFLVAVILVALGVAIGIDWLVNTVRF